MSKRFRAIVIGAFFIFGLHAIFSRYINVPHEVVSLLLVYPLPAFLSGMYAGAVVDRSGWLYGLLCAAFFWSLVWLLNGIMVLACALASIFEYSMIFFKGWRELIGLMFSMLATGTIGGFLGEKLAHKVSQK